MTRTQRNLVIFMGSLAVIFWSGQLFFLTPQPEALTITVQELRSLRAGNKPVSLVDVRQPAEYDSGHIDGAVLIPLNQLMDRNAEIARDKKVVAYCRSGKRSAQAVALLRAQGIANAVGLAGGYLAWQEQESSGPTQ